MTIRQLKRLPVGALVKCEGNPRPLVIVYHGKDFVVWDSEQIPIRCRPESDDATIKLLYESFLTDPNNFHRYALGRTNHDSFHQDKVTRIA